MTAPVREHGTTACYVAGCRRDECRAAARAAQAVRARAIAYGRWQPFTEAGPVRAHIQELRESGLGFRQVARQAGMPVQTVIAIVFRDPPVQRVRPATAAALLAVRPDPAALAPGTQVDVTGTRRRLQALVAIGHTQADLAAGLGITPPNLRRALVTQDQVTARTARAVEALYDELWNKPPPPSPGTDRARQRARAKGWPPPQAWDDDTIDDPAATPAVGWQRRRRLSNAAVAEEAADLLRFGLDRHLAAERLGILKSSLDTVLAREQKRQAS